MKSLILIFLIGFCYEFITAWFNPVTDYRDAYCGNYVCTRKYQDLDYKKMALTTSTSTYTVVVSKDVQDSVIDIAIKEKVLSVKLVNNKLIPLTIRCTGHFANDSIYLYYAPALGPQCFDYIGKM